MKVEITHDAKTQQTISEFLKNSGLQAIIGIIGGSDKGLFGISKDDKDSINLEDQYKAIISKSEERIVTDLLKILSGYPIGVITGGTKWGVPSVATRVAKKLGMKTIGIHPKCGEKHALPDQLLDLTICVNPFMGHSRFGDESALIAKFMDAAIIIGGKAGTMTECAHMLKINEQALKKKQKPIRLVPISNTGGMADSIHYANAPVEVLEKTLPQKRITTGREAAKYILRELLIEEFYTETI